MILDFLLVGLVALLAIPAISGYFAYTHGRSFWLWFVIGTFLPVISYFILIFLPDKSNPVDRELEDLRIKNGMLGLKPDVPLFDRELNNFLKEEKLNQIEFEIKNSERDDYQVVDIIIDGVNFKDLVIHIERPYALASKQTILAGAYEGIPEKFVRYPSKHLLGKPHIFYKDQNNNAALLVCENSGLAENWALMVQIEIYPRYVVWRKFKHHQMQKQWSYKELGLFVFDRLQYMEALKTIQNQML